MFRKTFRYENFVSLVITDNFVLTRRWEMLIYGGFGGDLKSSSTFFEIFGAGNKHSEGFSCLKIGGMGWLRWDLSSGPNCFFFLKQFWNYFTKIFESLWFFFVQPSDLTLSDESLFVGLIAGSQLEQRSLCLVDVGAVVTSLDQLVGGADENTAEPEWRETSEKWTK